MLFLFVSFARVLAAAPCDAPELSGPVVISHFEGGHGEPVRPCPARELFLGGRGALIADAVNFYGNIGAALRAAARWPLGGGEDEPPAWELFGTAEVVRYQLVISSVQSSDLGFGHLSLGARRRVFENALLTASGYVRGVLPTATVYHHSRPWMVELGMVGQTAWLRDLWALSAQLSSLASAGTLAWAQGLRYGLTAQLVGTLRLTRWISLSAGPSLAALQTGGVDLVGPVAALRLRFGLWGITLNGFAPLGGAIRSTATVELGVSRNL